MRRRTLALSSLGAALAVAASVVVYQSMGSSEPTPEPEIPSTAPTSSNPLPWRGQEVTLTGKVDTATVRPVVLQKYSGGWAEYAKGETTASGSYSFTASTTASSRPFRVLAEPSAALPAFTSDVLRLRTKLDAIKLTIVKNDEASAAVRGATTRKFPGRSFELQRRQGKTWKTIGDPMKESEKGTVETSIDIDGVAEFDKKDYRLVGEPVKDTGQVESTIVTFMPGPRKFGEHVLRIEAAEGTDIRRKSGPPGTVSVDGGKPLALEWVRKGGNSTSKLEKLPYKLRFEKKVDLFGMGRGNPKAADERFNLRASYQDPSLVRDKVGLDLGARLSGLRWTPRSTFTEVYFNSEYVGTYVAAQTIKIDQSRVDIGKKKGIVAEVTGEDVSENSFGFVSSKKFAIAFKDPDEIKDGPEDDPKKGVTPDKLEALENRVTDLEDVLYASAGLRDDPAAGWQKYIDIKSAVDYYLVKEFTKDHDADFFRSHFFSWADHTDPTTKFVLGPIWDFDRSAGVDTDADKADLRSPQGWWMRGTADSSHNQKHWFAQMTKDKGFIAALKSRWAEKKSLFKEVSATWMSEYAKRLGVAGVNDRDRWGAERRYESRGSSTQAEIDWVTDWYAKRYAWMDSKLS